MREYRHVQPSDAKLLAGITGKHREHVYRRPIAAHNLSAFEQVRAGLTSAQSSQRPMILDSCCGKAESSRILAKEHPEALVIGIDRSLHRLTAQKNIPENLRIVRCDCEDFWRLCLAHNLVFDAHSIFYPNPYPKSEHLKRRWYAHPVWPVCCAISRQLEIRSNEAAYIADTASVLDAMSLQYIREEFTPERSITAFERKYHEQGQKLYRIVATFSDAQRAELSSSQTTES